MKPCANQQKPIALLALGALDTRSAQALSAHLETCTGCRDYLAEISQVTEQLTTPALASKIKTTEAFHRNLMARVEAAPRASVWETLAALLRAPLFNWRVALPVTVAMAVLAVLLTFGITQRPPVQVSVHPLAPLEAPVTTAAEANAELAPTVANYQQVASQSLEKLDELLGRQGKQTTRATPVYKASASMLGF